MFFGVQHGSCRCPVYFCPSWSVLFDHKDVYGFTLVHSFPERNNEVSNMDLRTSPILFTRLGIDGYR